MRSLLFVPGNKQNMLEKAAGCRPDAIVPDMEDSVPDDEKGAARALIEAWLPRLADCEPLLVPRVNALGTRWFADDVLAVVRHGVDGISIGKVDSAGDISAICETVANAEREAGIGHGTLALIPWIETALAIENCFAIASASVRIVAIAFGGEDYTNDLGIERLDDESNVSYARSVVCNAARAAGVLALDTPFFRFRDDAALEANCVESKRIGFKGRFAIHPDQIATINACYSPNDAEIEEARRIVAAFEEAERRGRGSTSLDGRVIDVPVVRRARALLARTDERDNRVP